MDKLLITGGAPLRGSIPISGAKNAALPLMCASLLSDEPLTLSNMPQLADIRTMRQLLEQHGVQVGIGGSGLGIRENDNLQSPIPNTQSLVLNANAIANLTAPYELVRRMRASVLVLGPLLARFGAARVSLPGGCAIGTRPIDLHLQALEAMGAHIELKDGYVNAHVDGRLQGAAITFAKISVGATENAMMAAVLAEGKTTLSGAACEPEVQDLARCLNAMGAQIDGIGTPTITITGVERLHGAAHAVIADRIEAGTYAAAAAVTGGEVELLGAPVECMQAVIEKFTAAGVLMEKTPRGLRVKASVRLRGIDAMTEAYPGFPTDMQAQIMAMMAVADGASLITETIFENRFMHVPELARMGANVTVHGASAMLRGVNKLTAAEVMATDLRASVCLVIAALAAEGATTIHRVYHLDRGYERLEEKLRACGANIERVGERTEAEEQAA